MTNTLRKWLKAFEHRQRTALWGIPLIIATCLLIQTAPPIRADRCGDVSGANASASGCTDPAPSAQAAPPWLAALQERDPQFADSYMATRERILKDGAIPAKYKLLMGMITDAIAAHPDGVRTLADNARAAGASEAEITEAVEVGYLYGGTAALVMGVNAFTGR
jgi:alkylhydroperoxidase/carboxymuconolactone decarboxylase family protein YurZ